MINRDTIAKELYSTVQDIGLIETLYVIFGKNITIKLPYYSKSCNVELKDLNFSVRASNALNRCRVFTVGELIDLIQAEDLSSIKNLGKKSINEIRTKLLLFGYESLKEKDRYEFIQELLDINVVE